MKDSGVQVSQKHQKSLRTAQQVQQEGPDPQTRTEPERLGQPDPKAAETAAVMTGRLACFASTFIQM